MLFYASSGFVEKLRCDTMCTLQFNSGITSLMTIKDAMLIKGCTSSVSVGEGRFSKNRIGEPGLEESQWHLSK